MITAPDGREVVTTTAEATALASPPLLILDSIVEYLDGKGIGKGPIAWTRIGDGQSNVTYLIERAGQRFVLRRGPRPPLPKSTHDMVREASVQRLLGSQGVAVPRIIAVCDNANVLGVPFYIMEYLDGVVVTDALPEALDSIDQRRATSQAAVDTLADLHRIDVSEGELANLGRPDGYLTRQVSRFTSLWNHNPVRDLPNVQHLSDWLSKNQPATQRASVVHGDYRLGNLMLHPNGPARVLAVLDWEMATIGDPLADLGYLVATYAESGRPSTVMQLTSATRQPGYLTRAELVERYADRSGLDLSSLLWYEVLALWKSAIFCEAMYGRWLKGERPDDDFGPQLKEGVPELLHNAAATAGLH